MLTAGNDLDVYEIKKSETQELEEVVREAF